MDNLQTHCNDDVPAELALESLTTAVLLLDHELRIKSVNPAAQDLLAISGTRSVGETIGQYVKRAAEIESILLEALQNAASFTQRKARLTLIGGHSITADYTVTPILSGAWPILLIEIQPLDRLLRLDREEAIRIHQETTHQMIRGLAHEIKNPLGGIRGAAQLLARELNDPRLEEYTNIIVAETDRLKNLVDRLLLPNNLPKLTETNIHEVVERVCTLISAESPAVTFERDYDPSIPMIQADPDLLLQAILNVTRNAMQAIAQGVPQPIIALVTRSCRQVIIGKTKHRLAVTIDIIDNGPGVPAELKGQLFYPMISGRADGTGLGLSVAHAIISRHGGTIEFSSEPGRTCFSLILPMEPRNV